MTRIQAEPQPPTVGHSATPDASIAAQNDEFILLPEEVPSKWRAIAHLRGKPRAILREPGPENRYLDKPANKRRFDRLTTSYEENL